MICWYPKYIRIQFQDLSIKCRGEVLNFFCPMKEKADQPNTGQVTANSVVIDGALNDFYDLSMELMYTATYAETNKFQGNKRPWEYYTI